MLKTPVWKDYCETTINRETPDGVYISKSGRVTCGSRGLEGKFISFFDSCVLCTALFYPHSILSYRPWLIRGIFTGLAPEKGLPP